MHVHNVACDKTTHIQRCQRTTAAEHIFHVRDATCIEFVDPINGLEFIKTIKPKPGGNWRNRIRKGDLCYIRIKLPWGIIAGIIKRIYCADRLPRRRLVRRLEDHLTICINDRILRIDRGFHKVNRRVHKVSIATIVNRNIAPLFFGSVIIHICEFIAVTECLKANFKDSRRNINTFQICTLHKSHVADCSDPFWNRY